MPMVVMPRLLNTLPSIPPPPRSKNGVSPTLRQALAAIRQTGASSGMLNVLNISVSSRSMGVLYFSEISFTAARILSCVSTNSASSLLRCSPWRTTLSQTTLAAGPPVIMAKFAVVKGDSRPSGRCMIRSAVTRSAFSPFSGSLPAWAFLPCTVITTLPMPGACFTIRPARPGISKTKHIFALKRLRSALSAPYSPISSQVEIITSISPCGRFCSFTLRSACSITQMPETSSAARIVFLSEYMIRSSSFNCGWI